MSAEPAPETVAVVAAAAETSLPPIVVIGTKNAYKFGYEYLYRRIQAGGTEMYMLSKKEGQEDLCIFKEKEYWVVYTYTVEEDGSGAVVADKPRFRTRTDMYVEGDHDWEMYDEDKKGWLGELTCRTTTQQE